MTGAQPALLTRDLHVELGGRPVLQAVDLRVAPGEFVGLLGPNGAGKSTLMRTVGGLQAGRGHIELCGHALGNLSVAQRARLVATVPQSTDLDFAFTVADVVMMGRHAHLSRFAVETVEDLQFARRALARVGMTDFEDRVIQALSGGERQLVFLAKALAQDTSLLLLDEPVSALDLRHQFSVMQLVRGLRDEGKAVLASLHDVELAARFCDRLVLMTGGRVIADGPPATVLTAEAMRRAYQVEALVSKNPHTLTPAVHVVDVLP